MDFLRSPGTSSDFPRSFLGSPFDHLGFPKTLQDASYSPPDARDVMGITLVAQVKLPNKEIPRHLSQTSLFYGSFPSGVPGKATLPGPPYRAAPGA